MLFQKGVFNFHYFKYFKIHLNFLKFNVFVSYSEIAPEVLFYPKQQCVMILNSYYNGFFMNFTRQRLFVVLHTCMCVFLNIR